MAPLQKIGQYTQFDPSTGIYTSDITYNPASASCIYDYLLGSVDFDNSHEVLRECGTGRTILLGRLKSDVQRLGLGLIRKFKLKAGDTVLLYLYSSIDFATALLARQFVGLRTALVNSDYLRSEIKHVFRLTKPRKALVSSGYMARLTKAGIGGHNIITTDGNVFGFGGVESIKSLMVDEATAKEAKPHVPSNINDTAYLPFSSGTTGMPKAVEISHSNVINMVEIFSQTPALVKQSIYGAAPLDFETQSAFTKKTGVPVQQAFGMTETTVSALGQHGDEASGSVGCLWPATSARIRDVDTGKNLGPGERGELLVQGPQVCKGYYGNPEATRDTFTDDSYLRTGDIAVVDPRTGEFSIVDRLKELIKYKGFQVAPAELEGVLVLHPAIAAAAVVGLHDKEQGTELPLAFVELKTSDGQQDKKKIIEDIDSYVRSKVSHHKYLRGGIRILDKVPVSASGKILRKEIRKLLQAEIQAKDATAKAKL
ncbi:hypothetical protein NDA16_002740 [Ustilago loliicola]|nr:hypothetical protein NDA16_002740 [Ustilago loliicola]